MVKIWGTDWPAISAQGEFQEGGRHRQFEINQIIGKRIKLVEAIGKVVVVK